jgi:hypothetical protein
MSREEALADVGMVNVQGQGWVTSRVELVSLHDYDRRSAPPIDTYETMKSLTLYSDMFQWLAEKPIWCGTSACALLKMNKKVDQKGI